MPEPLSSVTGIASGIDSKALVEQILKLERRPADRLQATVDANTKRAEALNQFQTALAALKTAADGITNGSTFDGQSVSVAGVAANGRALFAASGGPRSVPGTYQVKVLALASSQKLTASAGQPSASAKLELTGAFDLRRPDGTVLGSVDVAGKSLAEIRDAINALPAGAKVRASIVSARADGTDQRLVIGSTQSGERGRFGLVATAGDPLAALGLAEPVAQPGEDARIEVDGIPVTRPSNTLTDVIDGVTLNLTTADPAATASVTVDRVKATSRDAMTAFVDAYNKVQEFIRGQSVAGGALAKESLLRTARGSLGNIVLAKGDGLPPSLATFGSVGLSLTKDGTLQFDAARFDAAYDEQWGDLKATLKNRVGAMADHVQSLAGVAIGSIDRRESALAEQNGRLTDRIADIDSRLEKKRAAMLMQYAKFEASLGRINAIGGTVTAQLAGLNKSRD
jgi:flagellar hook-associated protein 2